MGCFAPFPHDCATIEPVAACALGPVGVCTAAELCVQAGAAAAAAESGPEVDMSEMSGEDAETAAKKKQVSTAGAAGWLGVIVIWMGTVGSTWCSGSHSQGGILRCLA